MPTKFDPEVWEDVRGRMSDLITKGIDPKVASVRVSRALKGKPAAGTIYNKYRDGWNTAAKTGASPNVQVKGLAERLAALEATVKELQDRVQGEDVLALIEERAKFQGQAEALKDALLITETGQNGIPIGGEPA